MLFEGCKHNSRVIATQHPLQRYYHALLDRLLFRSRVRFVEVVEHLAYGIGKESVQLQRYGGHRDPCEIAVTTTICSTIHCFFFELCITSYKLSINSNSVAMNFVTFLFSAAERTGSPARKLILRLPHFDFV